MAKFKCKGEDIKPFVKALSVLGKDVTDFRLESNGTILTGSAVPEAHNALIMVKMDLTGLSTDGMDNLVAAVDMRNFRTLVDLAGPEDDLEVVMDLGRFNMRIGPHIQRSFPLVGKIPSALDPKGKLPFGWRMPAESIKPLMKSLNLEEKMTKLYVRVMDSGLMFATEVYGGTSKASYTVPTDQLIGVDNPGERFESMYPYEDVLALKDLPAEGEMSFRAGQDLPLEVVASTGRLSIRALFAPLIRTD